MKAIRLIHCCNVADHIILDFFDNKRIIEFIDVQKLKLYLNLLSNSPRYVHIDIGVTDDSYGFAMSTISGMREVEKFDVQELMDDPSGTGVILRSEPVIRTELALSIRSTTRVPLWKVRDFIVDLTELGFPIVKVTADQFQSEDTLQLLTKMGYETEVLSLDKTKEPHITFRNALYEGRCELPDFKLMITEFTDLVDKGKKFDHSTKGCFVGSTKIHLLNNRFVPIEDLMGNFNNRHVYSFDGENVVAGKIVNCFVTRQVSNVLRITFDNDEVVECTHNHLFMLYDGTYCEAKDLKIGTKLMSLYIYGRGIIDIEDVKLDTLTPVYDLTISSDGYSNFALAAGGVIVHNSKDITDAVVGSHYTAFQNSGGFIDIQ
jgi:hypothetical protein